MMPTPCGSGGANVKYSVNSFSSDCVWDFTNRKVSKKEEICAMNCAEKYLKMNQRISTRFQVGTHD